MGAIAIVRDLLYYSFPGDTPISDEDFRGWCDATAERIVTELERAKEAPRPAYVGRDWSSGLDGPNFRGWGD